MQRLVDEQQKNYPDLFEFTYGCSETAMKVASLPFSSESPENVRALVGVMFSRCVAQFQGAVILTERGLTIEAMLLARALYETVFVLGAIATNKVTPEELRDNDLSQRKTIGNALLPIAKKECPPEVLAKFESFILENAEVKKINTEDIAKRAGMGMVYDGIYRHLSHSSAHPSVTAAGEYYADQSGGKGEVTFRPLTDETPKAIASACSGILLACSVIERIEKTNSEINTAIAALLSREEELHEKYRPWGA